MATATELPPKPKDVAVPKIDIECMPSFRKYLKKSRVMIEIKEGQYAYIQRHNVTLQIFTRDGYIAAAQNDDDSKDIEEHVFVWLDSEHRKYELEKLPKEHRVLYFHLYKLIKKLRRKTVKYTIVRKRQLDPHDRITCLVSLHGGFTVHFMNKTIAYLHGAQHTEITLIEHHNLSKQKKKSIPFRFDAENPTEAPKYRDSYDRLRVIVHEFIACTLQIETAIKSESQSQPKQDRKKYVIVEWNADTGSVEMVDREQAAQRQQPGHDASKQQKYYDEYQEYQQPEGASKIWYHSETTMSSDFSDNNSEISVSRKTSKRMLPTECKQNVNRHEQQESASNEIVIHDDRGDDHAVPPLPPPPPMAHAQHGHADKSWRAGQESYHSLSAVVQEATDSMRSSIKSEASWRCH